MSPMSLVSAPARSSGKSFGGREAGSEVPATQPRKDAHDLLMQNARERGADVLLISEQYKWSENSSWFQDASRRAGILVCSPDLSVGDFLESDAGFA